MNRSTTVRIADAMCAINPAWKQGGCISQLQLLAHTWQGTDAELAAHALLVAGDPAALTPAAINNTPPRATPKPAAGRSPFKPHENHCHICGNTRDDCDRLYQLETTHGLPDPHQFETLDQAEANKARHQIDARQRARADLEEARRKVAYQPEQLPEPRAIQEPWPKQATETTHPGCDPAAQQTDQPEPEPT